jgi:hypothetical protein
MPIIFRSETFKGVDHLGYLHVNGSIMMKCILNKWDMRL